MNEKYIIADGGAQNFTQDGKVAGYEFKLRIPYYMGAPLSQVEFLHAKMDGQEVPQDKMQVVTSDGEAFKLSEIQTVYTYFWEYGEKLLVRVFQDGGLTPGKHLLEVNVAIDVIYAPKGIGFGSYAFQEFAV